ncbi:PHB depolymerase family esterase [Frankia sp. AiPs1]|uniref:alpha/beta hydrolase family esterase n=1 Tax=Frankia sp. AiPs1 TaxID=573493 RepID=UPI002043091A|nr:PHB depolymerase family esterase [Frankia sp. AiPs1]
MLLLLLWYAISRDPGPEHASGPSSAVGPAGGHQPRVAAVSVSPTPTVPAPPPSGCVTGKTLPSGVSTRTLRVGGVDRTYVLAVPTAGSPARELPLILTFHDLGQSTDDLEAYTRLADQGTRAGFAVAAPIGAQDRWNFPRAAAVGPDDVMFAGTLLNELTGRMCLDAKRIFAVGYADGANMVLTAACALPGRFAAAVTVGSSVLPTSCAAPTTNLLEIHGTADQIAPFDGGGAPRPAPFAGVVAQSTPDRLARYASALRCSGASQASRDTAAWQRTVWTGCPNGRDVGLLSMQGAGHTWPGAQARPALGPTSDAFSATIVALTYFGYTPTSGDGGGGAGTPGSGGALPLPGPPAPSGSPPATAGSATPSAAASASPSTSASPGAGTGGTGTPVPSASPSATGSPSPAASDG